MFLRSTILLLACCPAFGQVVPPSAELRENFKLGAHYEKVRMVDDFPVVSSAKVPDAALEEAAHTVRKMLVNRPDIIRKLAENRIRLGIMAVSERTTDLPEHSDLEPPAYWNRRARGLGATRERPCVSCGEENLLHNHGDPYSTESIMVHEFAHAIHMMAVNDLDPTFDQRLTATYEAAMEADLWKGLYAADNHYEYWAEAVQSWFDTNRENDAIHNHVNTRQELIEYDPALAALCFEVFGENEWRYVRADDPSREDEPHLKGLDRSELQPFAWTAEEQAAYDALDDEVDAAQFKITDGFGRDVSAHGIGLADWQGHLMNPMSRLTLTPPDTGVTYPLQVTIRASGTSRFMLDLPSTLSATGAEKTVTFASASDQVEIKLAIAPDRAGGNGEIETYQLTLGYQGQTQSLPVKVLDLDDDLQPKWPMVFDYRLDTITDLFDTPGFKEASELSMKDWFYFFDYQELDMVPAGAEVASLPGTGWINHETIANDQPYNGFWVFKRTHEGPYATGFPNNAGINGNRHTVNGVELPGRLARSGSLVMHDNPNANWLVSTDDEKWYLTDILQFVDVYGLTFHEFGHAIVFHEDLPGFKEYTETPEAAQSVVEYQGFPVPYGGSGHLVGTAESWDRLSGHSGGYGGVFPPRRWMLTKLVLLVAQETGWKLREIGPFIKAGITTAQLPDAELGEAYSQTLQTNNGGVPVYDWRIVAGALPEGLGLNRFTGEITGSPSAAGQYDFTVELKDDDALSQPVRKELSIQVATEISRIHLPDSATGFGDWAPTINGAVFADGQSIVSGVTNVQDALGFEMLPSADGGGDANGRAFGTDFAAVTVRYGFSTPLDGINGLFLWNYSEDFGGAPYNDRGVRFADVTVTHSGGMTTFPDVEFQQTPNQPGSRSMAQKITFGEILDGVTTLDLGNLRGYGGENQSGASFFLGWGEIAVTEGGSATPFQQWLDGFPTLTGADRHAGADPERDGSPNLIEFVTGGNPTLSDPEKLPRGELAGNHFIFTFIRPDRVLDSGVALTIEVGTTLASWPDVFTVGATTETSSPGITIIQNDAESDTLTLSLPLAGQPNRFARLVAVAD